jgi:hypothetical protein
VLDLSPEALEADIRASMALVFAERKIKDLTVLPRTLRYTWL